MAMTEDLLERVPEDFRQVFAEVVALTDAFCKTHLDEDYQQLCRDMAVAICQEDLPVKRGRPASWASGIVNALGRVNCLSDPSQKPHMRNDDVAKGFGVSAATMAAKSKIICEGLELIPMHPSWCVPSMLEDNPLVWMVQTTDGLIIDLRHAPREVQEEAYKKGMIPFIPADREKEGPDGTEAVGRPGAEDAGNAEPKSESGHLPLFPDGQDGSEGPQVESETDMAAPEGTYRGENAQGPRIEAILGDDEEMDLDEEAGVFYKHLKANLRLPCEVTGIEDFRWEEPYVLGVWDEQEYERLKKTQPSYSDRFELIEIAQGEYSEWMLFSEDDIAAHVRRTSDGREFCLGLAELEATDEKSPNYRLIHDYCVWFVNNR
ncbi:hypothetical protein LCGC14_1479640 [marine sediment metagenome]|uniref:DUF6398 domain-containing protein n=1 Tax=marine sediment metagenome TaxID=412755 RepID=A0A0F9MBM4_9ZZZZ